MLLLLYSGPLLGEVVKNMKDKLNTTLSLQQKALIYSAVCNRIEFKSLLNDFVLNI